MSHLLESKVQEVALKYLAKKYRSKWRRAKVFVEIEMSTKRKYGGKRADGLIVFRKLTGSVCVISIEAKSYKTLPAIKPYLNVRKFLWNCIQFGLLVSLVTGALYAIIKMDDGFWQILIPLWVFVLSALIYGILTVNSSRHKTIDVIEQLKQYPGNYQWLAFSKDSVNAISKKQKDKMQIMCQAQGIGLVIVSKNGKTKTLLSAKKRWKFFGDFLKYYSQEKKIREAIR